MRPSSFLTHTCFFSSLRSPVRSSSRSGLSATQSASRLTNTLRSSPSSKTQPKCIQSIGKLCWSLWITTVFLFNYIIFQTTTLLLRGRNSYKTQTWHRRHLSLLTILANGFLFLIVMKLKIKGSSTVRYNFTLKHIFLVALTLEFINYFEIFKNNKVYENVRASSW